MRIRMLLLLLLALLAAPLQAVATPVTLTVISGSSGGFSYSLLHNATSNCSVINVLGSDVQFCTNGTTKVLTGTLTADLSGTVLTNISGTISVSGGPDIDVTDGTIDFGSSAANTFGGDLVTTSHGTFYFLDHTWGGPANSFDGVNLRLWGNNWDTGNPGDPTPFDRWGIDLGATVTIVPEPATLMLVITGIGALAIRRRTARG